MVLVIFDLDGVLVDSEVLSCSIDAALLREIGAPLSTEDVIREYAGVSVGDMVADVCRRYGLARPLNFQERCEERFDKAIDEALEPIAGMEDVIRQLGERICVASSSSPSRIRRSLLKTRLLQFFDGRIFSASMVKKGKPAPDLFLFAANHLRTPPSQCVVVEDSIHGVRGAIAAGMTAIGFVGGSHCLPGAAAALGKAGAHTIATSSDELLIELRNSGLSGELPDSTKTGEV